MGGAGGNVRGMCYESHHNGIIRTARWIVAKGVAPGPLEQEGENGRWAWGSREPTAQHHSRPGGTLCKFERHPFSKTLSCHFLQNWHNKGTHLQ